MSRDERCSSEESPCCSNPRSRPLRIAPAEVVLLRLLFAAALLFLAVLS